MAYAEAKAEYEKVKELVETLQRFCEAAGKIALRDAESSLIANKEKLDAVDNLERNLRSIRARILADLKAIVQRFGNEPNPISR